MTILDEHNFQVKNFSVPEEHETNQLTDTSSRKAFSSPQESTDYEKDENMKKTTPKQKNLSECLLLGPQNFSKIFDNKQIIQNSESLFSKAGYFNNSNRKQKNKITKSFSVLEMCDSLKERSFDDILDILNSEKYKNDDQVVINLLNELYEAMEKDNMININVGSRTKIHILKGLYKYVESQNEQLLLNIGRIILAVRYWLIYFIRYSI